MSLGKNYGNRFLSRMLLIATMLLIVPACEEDIDAEEPINTEENEEVVNSENTVDIRIYTNDQVPISDVLFGVNNNWKTITNTNYSNFESALEGISYQGIRFPGGWESEYYDWSTNTTPGWKNSPTLPGASISTLNSTNPSSLSIVVPTARAMNLNIGSNKWDEAIEQCKAEAVDAINLAGVNKILSVEIGNEWWLQYGGGVSRSEKCSKYADIAKRIAKHIKITFPSSNFKLLVNGDYTVPSEFTTIKNIFGADIQYIDGVALHPYAGYDSSTHNITSVGSNIASCKANIGKNYVHLSEWAPSKAYNNNKMYAQGANVLVELFHEFARSGADAAAYWPPLNTSIVGLGLFNSTYSVAWPTGQIFKDMSINYKGMALSTETNGSIKAVASRNGKRITVYVAGMDNPQTTVRIRIVGNTPKSGIVESKIFVPGNTSNTAAASQMNLISNPSVYNSSINGYIFAINQTCQYSIQKLIFDLN